MPAFVSEFEQGQIYRALMVEKLKMETVAREVGRHRNTISTLRRHFVRNGAPGGAKRPRPPRGGKPHPKVLARRKAVAALARKTKRLKTQRGKVRTIPLYPSAPAIRQPLTTQNPSIKPVTARTIQRDLRGAGFKPYKRPTRPFHGHDQKTIKKRFEFSKYVATKVKKTRKVMRRSIVFTDEHDSTDNDHSSRLQWHSDRKKVIALDRKSPRNAVRVQLWAAIGYNYKSPLRFVDRSKDGETDKYRTQTARTYIDNCLARSGVVPHCIENHLFLMQDGARAHAANKVTEYLERKGMWWLKDWPPYSPDLNPIEELWAELERRKSLLFGPADDEAVLKAQLLETWDTFTREDINHYVESFEKKVRRCIQNRGQK